MSFKYDAFLSYSGKDSETVKRFRDGMANYGIRAFYTPEDVAVGESFNEAIAGAIESSRFFIIFISPGMFASQHSRSEFFFASDSSRKNGLSIIPLVIRECFDSEEDFVNLKLSDGMRLHLSGLNWIKGTFDEVLLKVNGFISREREINQLFKEADEAKSLGALNRAYSAYEKLTQLVPENVLPVCYNNLGACSAEMGDYAKAIAFYKRAGNEEEVLRIESLIAGGEAVPKKEIANVALQRKIGDYCDASIDLFYELLKTDASAEAINCLRTSYRRLLNYCKSVGGLEELIEMLISKREQMEQALKNAEKREDNEPNEIVRSYRTYLGLEFPESENYDVFISYKSADESLARRVYDYLISQGKRVFFACEVLSEMGKTEYRDAIMDALDHSQHLVLVTSSVDYITNNWVKEEWSFFVSKLIEEDHKGNLVMIIRDDANIKKEKLPPNLRYKQRLLMSNFKDTLNDYLI